MIKVINISSMTVEIKGVKIKPKKIHIFNDVTLRDRAKISMLVSVGKIKAYDLGLMEETKTTNKSNSTVQEVVVEEQPNETVEVTDNTPEQVITPKSARKK